MAARKMTKKSTAKKAAPVTRGRKAHPGEGYDEKGEPLKKGVVAATGISVTVTANKPLARRLEKAMSDAVLQASKEGIIDPEVIRERMAVARRAEKDAADAEAAAAAKAAAAEAGK